MRRSIIAGTSAVLIAVLMATSGCSNNVTRRTIELPAGGKFEETYETPKTWSVNAPEGTCWRITWTTSEGEVVKTVEGNGPAAGQSPAFGHSDIAIIDCSEGGGSDLSGDPWPHGSYPYVIGTVPEDMAVSQEPLVVVTAAALNYQGARNKLQSVVDNGPGSALPSATQVEAYMMLTVDSSGVTLHSALAQRFATFTITLDGQVIADKATGLNVTLTPLPEGWVAASSAIPAIPPGSTVVVTQRRLGATQDLVATLEL